MKKARRPKVNLILLHVNHTFLYYTNELDLKPLDTLAVPWIYLFLNVRKCPIQGLICFKLVLRLLVPLPLSIVVLMLLFHVAHLFSKMELLAQVFMGIVGSNHPLRFVESSYIVGLSVGCWPSPYPLDARLCPLCVILMALLMTSAKNTNKL
jgi:hypothetical protein